MRLVCAVWGKGVGPAASRENVVPLVFAGRIVAKGIEWWFLRGGEKKKGEGNPAGQSKRL